VTLPSNTIKIFVIASGLLMLPFFVQAKNLSFEDKTWEVVTDTTSYATKVSVRGDFDLYQAARAEIFGTNLSETAPLFSAAVTKNLSDIAVEVSQPTLEPKLVIRNNRAEIFEPGQDGRAVDLYLLRQMLLSNDTAAQLPVIESSPQGDLAATNSLGINELVAVGESDFTGSPRNRVHNVTVGADKFNGLIIAQGQEFSFNEYLGDVDGEHGFLPELVIKASGVIPEFGGGLCQVSSTTFRAAMNAGLPITARRNHSFAVQYYAPQGTDATIYPGSTDFKFVNNLNSSILIRTKIEGRKLYFEFYGTKDSRSVAFEGPYQYDKKADGSLKATWTRHVIQNGETTTQVFNSTYQPPARFHPQEQAATPNPQSPPETPPAETPPPPTT
jgi:vancomycin resistance protein YoaR